MPFLLALLFFWAIHGNKAGVAFAQQSNSPSPAEEEETLFSRSIENPLIAETFRKLQQQYLFSDPDRSMRELIEKWGILEEIEHQLTLDYRKLQAPFQTYASENLKILSPHHFLTERTQEILTAALHTASQLGFSSSTVNDLQVYLEPHSNNAYVMSFFPGQIIVVLGADLVKNVSSIDELSSIVGHEMGHTLGSYSIVRKMESILSAIAIEIAAKGVPESFDLEVVDSVLRNIREIKSPLNQKSPPSPWSAFSDPESLLSSQVAEDHFIAIIQGILSLPREHLKNLMAEFLANQMKRIEHMQRNEVTIQFHQLLTQIIADRFNGHRSQTIFNWQPTFEEVIGHFQIISALLLHSQEETADRIGSSLKDRRLLIAGFLRFSKLIDPHDSLEVVDRFIEDIVSQFKNTESHPAHSSTSQLSIRTSLSSHPPLMKRIAQLMKDPEEIFTFFSDPFLRLLLIEQSLRQKLASRSHLSPKGNRAINIEESQTIVEFQNSLIQLILSENSNMNISTSNPSKNLRLEKWIYFNIRQMRIRRQILQKKEISDEVIRNDEIKFITGNPIFKTLYRRISEQLQRDDSKNLADRFFGFFSSSKDLSPLPKKTKDVLKKYLAMMDSIKSYPSDNELSDLETRLQDSQRTKKEIDLAVQDGKKTHQVGMGYCRQILMGGK